MMEDLDKSIEADAKRFRWLLNGNGYFLEENSLCGHYPNENEQNLARVKIDHEMELDLADEYANN